MEKVIKPLALAALLLSMFLGYKLYESGKQIAEYKQNIQTQDSLDQVLLTTGVNSGGGVLDYDTIKQDGTSTIVVYDIANPDHGIPNATVKISSFDPATGAVNPTTCDNGRTDSNGRFLSAKCNGLKGAYVIDVTSKTFFRTYRAQVRSVSDLPVPTVWIGL